VAKNSTKKLKFRFEFQVFGDRHTRHKKIQYVSGKWLVKVWAVKIYFGSSALTNSKMKTHFGHE